MKAIFSLFFILILSRISNAQNTSTNANINETISEVHYLDLVDSISTVLPIEVTLNQKMSIEDEWNKAFDELSQYTLTHAEWNFNKDKILFSKIQEINLKTEALNQPLPFEHLWSLKKYILNRITKYSTSNPEETISSYYFFNLFFHQDSKISIVFKEAFEHLHNQNTLNGAAEKKLFLAFLEDSLQQSQSLTANDFLNLISFIRINMQNFIPANINPSSNSMNLNNGQEDLIHEAQYQLQLLLQLYQAKESQLVNISIAEWDHVLVERHRLFQFFRKTIPLKTLSRFFEDHSHLSNASESHSYLEITVLLQAQDLQNKLWGHQFQNALIKWEQPNIQNFISQAQHLLNFNSSVTTSDVEGPHTRYQSLFSQIEILKTLLDLKTSLHNSTQPIISKSIINNGHLTSTNEHKWYLQLNSLLDEAIAILQLTQYKTALIEQCYKQNSTTPTCNQFKDQMPFAIVNPLQSHSQSSLEWKLQTQKDLFIPAGIFEFAVGDKLFIKAPHIEFHPLAIIKIPSGRIEIETQTLESPWLDVSGIENLTIPPKIFPGSRPWIKDSKHCQLKQYLEGANVVQLPVKSCETCSTKQEWSIFTFKNKYPQIITCFSHAMDGNKKIVGDFASLIQPGFAPDDLSYYKWNKNFNGNSSGDLILTVQEQISNPLLFALGADGTPGFDGQSSPQCKDEQFEPFKVVLSHSHDEFERWMKVTQTNPYLKLSELDSDGYHRLALFEIRLPRTPGVDGGSGGHGGQIFWNLSTQNIHGQWKFKSYYLSGGTEGFGGKAGTCGPNQVEDGANGLTGAPGKFFLGKNNLISK